LIDPVILFRPGTLFCTGNASKGYGATTTPGAAGLLAAYHPAVAGSGGKTYSRDSTHLVSSPTDLQAEVLVPGPIPLSAVQAVATRTVEQAATDVAILARLSLPVGSVRWVVAPLMFEPYRLATAIPSRPSPG